MTQAEFKEQRRSRSIAMTSDERDEFLRSERVCRVASVGGDGAPHVTPLWFVWDGASLWLNSIVRSQRWVDLAHHPRTAIVIDGGVEFSDLHGVEIEGLAEQVGDVPRTAEPNDELAPIELAFARKYANSDVFFPDGRHGWLRVTPSKISSWDFRKNQALQTPR
ncbi:MAG: pyridoxamine 5'-phosphate oxidase family protein [Actinomycetota bacterium]|nr:pyridoxamine 5'-phosphate oxidase family protein [Actinomycetota bacterium]